MVAFLTNSEHCNVSDIDREKAWYLLAVLLRIGRPARPAELSARCTLFHASPDFVQFLCLIPHSPLFLTNALFVTISLAALSAFEELVSKALDGFVPRDTLRVFKSRRSLNSVVLTYSRKRKGPEAISAPLPGPKRRLLLPSENDENKKISLDLANRIKCDSAEGHVDIANSVITSLNLNYDSGPVTSLFIDPDIRFSSFRLKNNDLEFENECKKKLIVKRELLGLHVHTPTFEHSLLNNEMDASIHRPVRVTECKPDLQPALLSIMENSMLDRDTQIDEMELGSGTNLTVASCPEVDWKYSVSVVGAFTQGSNLCGDSGGRLVEDAVIDDGVFGWEDQNISKSDAPKVDPENTIPPDNAQPREILRKDFKSVNTLNSKTLMTSFRKEKKATKVETEAVFPLAEHAMAPKQQTRSFVKLKHMQKDASTVGSCVLSGSLDYNKAVNSDKQLEKNKRDQMFNSMKRKSKQNCKDMHTKENRADPTIMLPKNHSEPEALPNFESYIIEEEEGSGGYGTVYRARRKDDGKLFAIKYPHANAHTHHVKNELKMLERFGGRNFVIKYEGSFMNGNSECFLLEHVEHDRPEVLKREIDIFQLKWYGYCMFQALASLHKQGIVHRDVKPGNFLFSRKLNKGYLIDFNLAMDLQQKYGHSSKSKTSRNTNFSYVPIPSTKSNLTTKGKKVLSSRVWEAFNQEAAKDNKTSLGPKNAKKRVDVSNPKAYPELGKRTIFRNQGADGSGITSTKDATSTRTPSAERLREPLPCQGRKELISLVQEAMQSPNHDAVRVTGSQRKRVAATPGKVEGRFFYPTPMPLHSTGVAVAGASQLKNKGDGKHKREGPCVGTKGFRAPEVLFRSPHQGFKVDVWSAGVTLLYLMIGRTPFVGDPEQNIKDIVKLRGSEDMWEVARLHNRESSFPMELFDIQALPSMGLRDWCEVNTKRPDFLELIPRSLFDLVDKCLIVNPRLRISAEEALKHEFFASSHENLRKQRLLRRGLSLDLGSPHLSTK
ncbi:uncharacterized protein LOC122082454 isoform X2 [Macadamia integrifolia]|uniref:uncharacterized protein LOC122082454 isoform X2 n=1 Tax=Macadamia integrifolia TaxID=60698 RepID=UPI001C4FA99E|nr:uncharacterized protein LOC122082454 isoform X2 [Macadamia integrifolia]